MIVNRDVDSKLKELEQKAIIIANELLQKEDEEKTNDTKKQRRKKPSMDKNNKSGVGSSNNDQDGDVQPKDSTRSIKTRDGLKEVVERHSKLEATTKTLEDIINLKITTNDLLVLKDNDDGGDSWIPVEKKSKKRNSKEHNTNVCVYDHSNDKNNNDKDDDDNNNDNPPPPIPNNTPKEGLTWAEAALKKDRMIVGEPVVHHEHDLMTSFSADSFVNNTSNATIAIKSNEIMLSAEQQLIVDEPISGYGPMAFPNNINNNETSNASLESVQKGISTTTPKNEGLIPDNNKDYMDIIHQLQSQLLQKDLEMKEMQKTHSKTMREQKEEFKDQIQALQMRLYISETKLKNHQDALQEHLKAVGSV